MSTILLKNIYKEGVLDKDSTCKEYLQVAHEGSNVLKFAAMRAKVMPSIKKSETGEDATRLFSTT